MTDPADGDDAFDQVLAAYLEIAESGVAPDQATLVSRHPEFSRELQDFLAASGAVDQYLARLRLPEYEPESAPPSFGDYQLHAEIGRGGMGVVFRARQKSLNRLVALKMVRHALAEGDRDADLRRFRAEAEAAAGLDHPHIIPIYEIGEHEGRPFFTMKIVDGGSLAEHLAEYQVDPRGAAELLGVIARAVHHAHQRGILHRDLKPSNILLDSDRRPYVADFGLAKWLRTDQAQTETSVLVGTPAYMAPEQLFSNSTERAAVTTASDIYGLGAVLYTLLVGRPPFRGAVPLETLLAVREQEPMAPARLNPRVDRDLQTICLKCLAKDPDRRYGSALALAEDLDRWLAGEAILARPTGSYETAVRWCRKNPTMAATIAAATALLLFGVSALVTGYTLASRAQEDSEIHRQNAERQAERLRERLYAVQMGVGFRRLQRGELRELKEIVGEFRDDRPLTGFECRWLEARSRETFREAARYAGHSGIVYSAAFSPDGTTAVSCGEDSTLQLWDPVTGTRQAIWRANPATETAPIKGRMEDENCVRYSPNGELVAGGSETGEVRVWSVAAGTYRSLLPAHQGEVLSVDFSRDGRWLVSAGADGVTRVWDLEAPGSFIDFVGNGAPVAAASFSPSGREVAAVDKSGAIHVWDRESKSVRFESTLAGQLLCVAFSPDGSLLACGGHAGTLYLWNTTSWRLLPLQKPVIGSIRSVDFSADGTRLACAGDDGGIFVWQLPGRELLWNFNASQGRIWCVRFAPDGRRILVASEDTTARLWELPEPPETIRWLPSGNQPVSQVAFAPSGAALALAVREGPLLVGSATATDAFVALPIEPAGTTPPVFSPDGSQIAAVTRNGKIRRWDFAEHRELAPFDPPPSSSPPVFAWHPYAIRLAYMSSTRLAALRFDGRLWICEGSDWREHAVPCRSPAEPPLLAYLPQSGDLVMNDRHDSVVRFWNVQQEQVVRDLPCPAESITAISPDGRRFTSGSGPGNITLLEALPGTEKQMLLGHHGQINSLVFSPDGKTLASASRDGTVRLWHVATGQELFVLEDLHRAVHSLCFSGDGRFLAVAGDPFLNGSAVAIYDSNPTARRK